MKTRKTTSFPCHVHSGFAHPKLRPGAKPSARRYSWRTAVLLLASASFPSDFLLAAAASNDADIALKRLEAAPGLQVELFASDPLLFNPVAFSIDEKGRFFIAETHRYRSAIFDIWSADQSWKDADASFRTVEDRADFLAKEFASDPQVLTKDSEIIRLVEDRNGDGQADFSEVFADRFNETVSGTAAGILAQNGELWFASIPDLWRFEMNEAGKATRGERLHTGYGVHIGVSGHDLHGLVMGPDGKLYFSIGDRGARIRTQEGTVLDYPDTGAVFRCNPDGSDLQVFAIGLRNPQDLTFDRYGNLWTHDNDTGGADKSRVIHVVEGGDYGWRYSYQFMTGFGPWVQEEVWAGGIDDVLSSAGYGAQGPAGLAYYPGVGLPERYDGRFIACDFPQGVWSYSMQPKGASYAIGQREKFLWNAGPTHVAFGPDGNVYISDWGRTYSLPAAGRIYRVFDPEQADSPAKADLRKLLSDGMENRPLDELKRHLGHADMRVRQAAQFQLVAMAADSAETAKAVSRLLQEVARNSANPLARAHAIWGLEALLPEDAQGTLTLLLNDPDAEVRAQAAKLIGSSGWSAFAPGLAGLLQDPAGRVRAFAASSLGRLARAGQSLDRDLFLEPLLQFLRNNNDRDAYLTHAGMMALLDLEDLDIIERAATDSSAAVRRAALLCMRRLGHPEIAEFLDDSDERLRLEAARAINDVPIPTAMAELAEVLAAEATPTSLLSRALNANFRIGGESSAARLAAFAQRDDAPDHFRAEAMAALGDWPTPAPRDRVVGLWRPLGPRDPAIARSALVAVAKDLLAHAPEEVQRALIESAAKLDATEIAGPLFDLLQKPEISAALRCAVPAALVELDFHRLPEMMAIVLSDNDPSVRRAGVELLDQVEVPNTSGLLATLIATETDLRLSQSALSMLGRTDDAGADAALTRLLDQLLAGELQRELHLDLLEAAAKRSSPEVKQRVDRYARSHSAADPLAPHRALLAGGDAGLGRKIFHERDELGCVRCHAIGGKGGNVGPDLAGIGKMRSRQHLLESILMPNEDFSPGHERIVLVLNDGRTIAGVVEEETTDAIVLSIPEKTHVRKRDIQKRHPAVSAMPDGLKKFLTDRELRDLIEYLANLKQ